MARADNRTTDDVTAFIRQARRFTSRTAVELQQFSSSLNAATQRVFSPSSNEAPNGVVDFVDEMRARDEELKAVTEELTQQIDTLQRSCALLELERAKYVHLFEHAPDAYVVTTLGGTIHEANVAARILFGVERGFLPGRALIGFVARQDTRAFRGFLQEALEVDAHQMATPRALTLRVRPRGQSVFVVTARMAIVRAEAGRPVALRWMLRRFDRGETRTGGRLADGELARLVVDDLSGPLTPILEWSRALLDGRIHDEQERKQALQWIGQSAETQRGTLHELAELAERSGDNLRAGAQAVDVADCAATVIAVIAEGAPTRLALRIPGSGVARVRGDASEIERALELLIRRGLDGTPQSAGAVQVAVSTSGEHAVVEIEPPGGAWTSRGWTLRSAIAACIVEAQGGELVLHDAKPSARVLFPLLRT